MSALKSKLQDYLKVLSGEPAQFTSESSSKLPLFLRDRYSLVRSKVFGRSAILAFAESTDASPGELETDAAKLRTTLGDTVILVIDSLSSHDRNRLVHRGVPFIVPASQTFIPMVFLDLRERQPLPQATKAKKLTPAAQCLLLYHLQKSALDEISMNYLASKIGYSAIMMSKVRTELQNAKLAESRRVGKTVVIRFKEKGLQLWQAAQPYLKDPVRKKYWVRWKQPGYPALRSGISALSDESMLSDDQIPTYALWHKSFQQNLEKGLFHGCRTPDEANTCVEAWTYNPLVTGGDQKVDKLSLYLSLMNNPDERVQQQLEYLTNKIAW